MIRMKIDFVKLIVSIIICQAIGGIGSIFTAPSIPTWYASLAKPWFTPPNWVFAPVWITLFLLMGRKRAGARKGKQGQQCETAPKPHGLSKEGQQ